jgi:hypothetical protein
MTTIQLLHLLAAFLMILHPHQVWQIVGEVHGHTAVCLITRHGHDLWANYCQR